MILAATKSVAASFFASQADGTSDADSSAGTSSSSKSDTNETPDFLALLALLLPVQPLPPAAPVTPEPTAESTEVAEVGSALAQNGLLTATLHGEEPLPSTAPAIPMQTTLNPVPSANAETPVDGVAPPPENALDVPASGFNAHVPVPQVRIDSASVKPVAAAPVQAPPMKVEQPGAPMRTTPSEARVEAQSTTQVAESTTGETASLESPQNEHTFTNAAVSPPAQSAADQRDRDDAPASALARTTLRGEVAVPADTQAEVPARPAISFVDQVHAVFHEHVDQLRQQGRVELHMDLHPPELGKMRLHFSMEDNQVSVRMDVQDDRAKALLDQQLQPLRVHFSEMGVSLGELDVRSDSSGNAPQRDPHADTPARESSHQEPARLRHPYERGRTSESRVDVLV